MQLCQSLLMQQMAASGRYVNLSKSDDICSKSPREKNRISAAITTDKKPI